MKNTSALSFVRKSLKVKGRSQHNGRGGYECAFDCSTEELCQRVRDLLPEWEKLGVVENVEEDKHFLIVTLKDLFKDEYYRKFYFRKKAFKYSNDFACIMTW